MSDSINKTYIAIDLKSFYASVECVERGLDPLTTNLVVADAARTSKTICLAVTPSLKQFGLSGRSRLFEVEKTAEDYFKRTGKELEYIIARPRMQLYVDYSTEIYKVYLKYVSEEDIIVYSIDEVFMDVTNYLSLYNMKGRELASKIIQEIYDLLGITATAGIGTNLYLCKIAMDIVAKKCAPDKNGVRIAELNEQTFKEQLWDHKPLTDFWRTGRGTEKRLNECGMYTMGDVARMSIVNENLLYKLFGIDAEILIDHAWGFEPCTISDVKKHKPRTNCISSGQVLKQPYTFDKARIIVREMAELAVLDLVDKGLVAQNVSLAIGYDRENVDNNSYTGEVIVDYYGRSVPKGANKSMNLGEATSSTQKICNAILDIYDEIVNPDITIRRITIGLNNLKAESEVYQQYSLFSTPQDDEKEKKLQKAMLSIQKRYGKNSILKGTNLQDGAMTIERNAQIGGHRA